MVRYSKCFLLVLLFGFHLSTSVSFSLAEEKEDDELTQERKAKEKEQQKRDKKFNEEKVYKFMVGRDVLPLPMFYISLYVNGRLVEGKLRVAVQTSSPAARRSLNVEKNALRGIIYPLAIRMWENGRPTTEDIRNFKAEANAQLKTRFDDLVKEVFIESIL